jgi:uncharacterized protein (DUF169 family)
MPSAIHEATPSVQVIEGLPAIDGHVQVDLDAGALESATEEEDVVFVIFDHENLRPALSHGHAR